MQCNVCKRHYYDGSCEPNLCDDCYDKREDAKDKIRLELLNQDFKCPYCRINMCTKDVIHYCSWKKKDRWLCPHIQDLIKR